MKGKSELPSMSISRRETEGRGKSQDKVSVSRSKLFMSKCRLEVGILGILGIRRTTVWNNSKHKGWERENPKQFKEGALHLRPCI